MFFNELMKKAGVIVYEQTLSNENEHQIKFSYSTQIQPLMQNQQKFF